MAGQSTSNGHLRYSDLFYLGLALAENLKVVINLLFSMKDSVRVSKQQFTTTMSWSDGEHNELVFPICLEAWSLSLLVFSSSRSRSIFNAVLL